MISVPTMTTLKRLTLILLSIMISPSSFASLPSYPFEDWGMPRRDLNDENTNWNDISFLEPCDYSLDFPELDGRFSIPGEFEGPYGRVALKPSKTNGVQSTKCWVYQPTPMNFDAAKEFCLSSGFRLNGPVDELYSDRALGRLALRNVPQSTEVLLWLGMERDANLTLRWPGGTEVTSAGYTRPPLNLSSEFQHAVSKPSFSSLASLASPAYLQPIQSFGTEWRAKSKTDTAGIWCTKELFRNVPCGNCMDRGSTVGKTTTFNCSLGNINFNNRRITYELNYDAKLSSVLSDMKESVGKARYVSKMVLGYKGFAKEKTIHLATYTPTVIDDDDELFKTTEGSESFRTITAGGGTIDGTLEGNDKTMWLALSLENMPCNVNTSGEVGCWIEYYVKGQSYPRVEHLIDFTHPARIHEVNVTKRKSMFDTLNEKNVTVYIEMSFKGIKPEFYLVSCDGTKSLYTFQGLPEFNQTESERCQPTHSLNFYVMNIPNMFTPDICNISVRIVYEIVRDDASVRMSDKDGTKLDEPAYILDEVVIDVQPDCSSTLKVVSATSPLINSIGCCLFVTHITVFALLSLPIARWIWSKLQGSGSKQRADDASGKAKNSKDEISINMSSSESDGKKSISENPMSVLNALPFPDNVSRAPSFTSKRMSYATPNIGGSQKSKSDKSGTSSKKTGTGSVRSDKGSTKSYKASSSKGSTKSSKASSDKSAKSAKGKKTEPAKTLGIDDKTKSFIRDLSAHALDQMIKNNEGRLT